MASLRLRIGLGAVILLLATSVPMARAQETEVGRMYPTLYRPPEAVYLERSSPNFRIIYERGLEEEAVEAAALLEATLPTLRTFVGLERRLQMPVVLNRFNDRSNGYVTFLPFKQEVEGVRIRGLIVPARYPSWLSFVLPHELAHAAHAEAGDGLGVGAVLRPFVPDLSRGIQFTAPPGISEGAAVFVESHLYEGAGRLNDPFFRMQFRAAVAAGEAWSLAQMLQGSRYTYPFDRHYNGGAHFFAFMAGQERVDFFRRATDFYYRMPLLGYGPALWYGARQWPASLGRSMRRSVRAEVSAELEAGAPFTAYDEISAKTGIFYHRPRWLSSSELVVYGGGYALRPGFFTVDAQTGARRRLSSQAITEDYWYAFDRDTSHVLFARYVTDPFASVKSLSDVFRLDLRTGETRRLTTDARTTAPVAAPDGGLWGLRPDGQFNQWVHLDPAGAVTPRTPTGRLYLSYLAPAPSGTETAVLLNVDGRQGIYRVRQAGGGEIAFEPWVVLQDASIYDVNWSPDGRYLLFTADPGGVADIFAWDVAGERLHRLTNVRFGAREPDVSPDGAWLAFVAYEHERLLLARIPFDPSEATVVAAGGLLDPEAGLVSPQEARAVPNEPEVFLTPERGYDVLRGLEPRAAYPVFWGKRDELFEGEVQAGIGVGVQGGDPLERIAYGAEAFVYDEELWGDARVSTGWSVLRPELRGYRLPELVTLEERGAGGAVVDTLRARRVDRGVGLGVMLPLVLSENVDQTVAQLAAEASYGEDRYHDLQGEALTPSRRRVRVEPAALLAFRLHAAPRDIVPSRGLLVRSQARLDVWSELPDPERWVYAQADLFLPGITTGNASTRLFAAILDQNRGGLMDLTSFLPPGYEDRFLGRGTYAKAGAEYTQPLWFVDDGMIILPVYLDALFGFGFAEALRPVGGAGGSSLTSVGGGLGLQFRLGVVPLQVKLGVAYRLEDGEAEVIVR